MQQQNRKWTVISVLALASILFAACAPQTVEVPVTVVVAGVPEQVTVVETQIVEVEKEAFTTPHPILGDLRVRQAIAYGTNRDELIASVYSFVDDKSALRMDSFIPTAHWAHADGLEAYDFDPDKAKALLDEAGWTLGEGAAYRTNADGDELALQFTTTTAQFRQTWAAVFESNMADIGMRIVRLHAPASWWFGDTTGLSRRDFELGAFAWVGDADPGGQSLYSCDTIPTPANGWAGQNYMGWCNETADAGIKGANNTLSRDERIAQYAIAQQEFANDMISLPLFNRVEVLATNKDLTGFAPAPGEAYASYNIYDWEIPGVDTIVLGFTQEPASLFTLVENAYVAVNAYSLIGGRLFTSLNYDYTANLYYQQLPTLENGGAVLNTVEVKDGDKVLDADGNIVELAAGMKIKNADGETVDFAGGSAQMQQMVLTWTLDSGITWSDGEPLKAADSELGFKINCDPASGAVDYTVCERTASAEFPDDTTQVYTLIPGYTPPVYFTINFGWYPSHLVLADGRTLADVPAAEWTTVPEIAETPIDTGPYMLTGWVKGQSMTFTANPFFYKGAPKTPNMIIKFVADTNQAVAQLLTGDVDVLFGETLGAGAEVQTVKDAADAGEVAIFIEPSATWEHIDMSLFIR
ncbi:MAG: ABC transporter substrate-binding protein [Chloroflexota bacterium]